MQIQSVTGEEREVLPLTLEGGLLAMMGEVKAEAEAAVASIPGATVEDNKYSVSVHFRNCHLDDWPKVRDLEPRSCASGRPRALFLADHHMVSSLCVSAVKNRV